jgi:hypothetical protein
MENGKPFNFWKKKPHPLSGIQFTITSDAAKIF